MNRSAIFGGFFGFMAAVIAWFIALPFRPVSAPKRELFSKPAPVHLFETFYGWFHPLMFGLLAGAGISLVYAIRGQQKLAALRVIGSTLLGGALVTVGGAIFDSILQSLLRPDDLFSHSDIRGETVIHAACLSLGLCFALIPVLGRSKLRQRLGISIMVSIGASLAVLWLIVPVLVAVILAGAVRGNADPDIFMINSYVTLAIHVGVGIAVGASLAISENLVRTVWLRLRKGNGVGMVYALEGGKADIGTAPGCDLELHPMPGTAPVHAHIEQHGEDVAIHAVADGFPVFVNGVHVSSCWLQSGDVILLGPYEFEFFSKRPGGRRTSPVPSSQGQNRSRSVSADGLAPCRLIDSFGNEHPLAVGRSLVGRDLSCTVALPWEAMVSAQHAEIVIDAQDITIVDLNSRGGTRVNGVLASVPKRLTDGDTIDLAGAKLTFRL